MTTEIPKNDDGPKTGDGSSVPSVASSSTAAAAPVAALLPVNHSEKPEKFNGTEFRRWQQKMLFYLTTLRLARFLTEDPPTVAENEMDTQVRMAYDDWKTSDYLCRNYILNGLDNALYTVYCFVKSAKELWLTLEKKYISEDAGLKKFVVGRFLDYKMVDSKSVMRQVQELQVLLHEIHTEGMVLSESFQVAAVIWKLPPSWKAYKKQLKHKRKDMNMEDLVVRLRMEEDTLNMDKKDLNPYVAKANMIEQGGKAYKGKQNNKRKGKGFDLGPRVGVAKKAKYNGKPRFAGRCFVCDKPGHRAAECKNKEQAQANMTEMELETLSDGVEEKLNLSA